MSSRVSQVPRTGVGSGSGEGMDVSLTTRHQQTTVDGRHKRLSLNKAEIH